MLISRPGLDQASSRENSSETMNWPTIRTTSSRAFCAAHLPKVTVYEDALTLAFLDIMPSVEGHTLVIPKEPAESILELSPEGAAAVMVTTQKIAKAIKKAFASPGIMLVQLNGAAAGQSSPISTFMCFPARSVSNSNCTAGRWPIPRHSNRSH